MSYRTFDRFDASTGAAGSWKRWLCCACCTDTLSKVGLRSATANDETVIYRTVIVSSRATCHSSSEEEEVVGKEHQKVNCKVNCAIHAAANPKPELPIKLVISRASSSSSSSEEEKSSTNTVIDAEKDPIRPSRLRARPTPVYIPSS